MSKEKGEELFCALNVILDAITGFICGIWRPRLRLIEGSLQQRPQPNLQKKTIRLITLTGRTFLSIQFPLLLCLVDLVLLRSLVLLARLLMFLQVLLLSLRRHWRVDLLLELLLLRGWR
jgi:hypothetical protein